MDAAQPKRPRFSARDWRAELSSAALGWTPLVILLLFVAVSAWFLNALDTDERPLNGSRPSNEPDFYMERFETTVMGESGEPRRRLSAQRMSHFPESDTKEFTKPHMVVFRDTGEPWHVTASRGWSSPDDEVLVLLGEVHIWRNAPSGERELDIETEDLRVITAAEMGETDRPVVIRTPTTETRGVGMRAYLAESRLELDSRVKTVVQPGAF